LDGVIGAVDIGGTIDEVNRFVSRHAVKPSQAEVLATVGTVRVAAVSATDGRGGTTLAGTLEFLRRDAVDTVWPVI